MRAFSYAWSLRSCDEDGGRTIQSAIAKNPMKNANFMALSLIELELWVIKVLRLLTNFRSRRCRTVRPIVFPVQTDCFHLFIHL